MSESKRLLDSYNEPDVRKADESTGSSPRDRPVVMLDQQRIWLRHAEDDTRQSNSGERMISQIRVFMEMLGKNISVVRVTLYARPHVLQQ